VTIDDKQGCQCALGHSASQQQRLISLGSLPIAGYLEASEAAAKKSRRFDCSLSICVECGLVYQTNTEVRGFLAQKVYADYQPTYSASQRVRTHALQLLRKAASEADLNRGDDVVEIGSNDGEFLRIIEEEGYRATGFEPSKNKKVTSGVGSRRVIQSFFGLETACEYVKKYGKTKLLITRHTLEHAFDAIDFLKGISTVLEEEGLAVIEVPYLHHQILMGHIESMAFQHRTQFSVTSLSRCLSAAGLNLLEVRFVDFDGGAMVVTVQRSDGRPVFPAAQTTAQILRSEEVLELDRASGFAQFESRVSDMKQQVRKMLRATVDQGGYACAYGAGGKGQNLINMIGLDTNELTCVVDDNPEFIGKYVPGTSIPVVDPELLVDKTFDLVLVTAPTHVEQLIDRKIPAFEGAIFALTVPDFHLLTPNRNFLYDAPTPTGDSVEGSV
jgi:hypothetical protein